MSRQEDCYSYVRSYYGVPAYIGVRVKVRERSGVLVKSNQGQYVSILFDGDKRPTGPFHPTDGIEYQPVAVATSGDQPAAAVPSKPAASSSHANSGAGTEQTAPATNEIGKAEWERQIASVMRHGHLDRENAIGFLRARDDDPSVRAEQTAPAEPSEVQEKLDLDIVRPCRVCGAEDHAAMLHGDLQRSEAADGRSSAPTPQPRLGDTR